MAACISLFLTCLVKGDVVANAQPILCLIFSTISSLGKPYFRKNEMRELIVHIFIAYII